MRCSIPLKALTCAYLLGFAEGFEAQGLGTVGGRKPKVPDGLKPV